MSQACEAVLVVEDTKEIRETLRLALELEGYTVFEASHGQEAIQALSTMPRPCLILLDLMMPVMNGFEFLKYRRTNDVIMTIPVVVITAAGESKLTGLEAEAVMKKPIDLDALIECVKQYCGEPTTLPK